MLSQSLILAFQAAFLGGHIKVKHKLSMGPLDCGNSLSRPCFSKPEHEDRVPGHPRLGNVPRIRGWQGSSRWHVGETRSSFGGLLRADVQGWHWTSEVTWMTGDTRAPAEPAPQQPVVSARAVLAVGSVSNAGLRLKREHACWVMFSAIDELISPIVATSQRR